MKPEDPTPKPKTRTQTIGGGENALAPGHCGDVVGLPGLSRPLLIVPIDLHSGFGVNVLIEFGVWGLEFSFLCLLFVDFYLSLLFYFEFQGWGSRV